MMIHIDFAGFRPFQHLPGSIGYLSCIVRRFLFYNLWDSFTDENFILFIIIIDNNAVMNNIQRKYILKKNRITSNAT